MEGKRKRRDVTGVEEEGEENGKKDRRRSGRAGKKEMTVEGKEKKVDEKQEIKDKDTGSVRQKEEIWRKKRK